MCLGFWPLSALFRARRRCLRRATRQGVSRLHLRCQRGVSRHQRNPPVPMGSSRPLRVRGRAGQYDASAPRRGWRERFGPRARLRLFRRRAGLQLVALGALHESGQLLPSSSNLTAVGPQFGVGSGLRLLFLTAGPRFRYAHFSHFDLWTLNLDLGWHVPLGNRAGRGVFGGLRAPGQRGRRHTGDRSRCLHRRVQCSVAGGARLLCDEHPLGRRELFGRGAPLVARRRRTSREHSSGRGPPRE